MEKNKDGLYTNYHNNTLIGKQTTNKKYVILSLDKVDMPYAGLGWYVTEMLMGIRAAFENGFIPVVDWQAYPLPFYDRGKVGVENVWEYFFEQPCACGLKEAYQSENFYLIDKIQELYGCKGIIVGKQTNFSLGDEKIWHEYFQQYIRLNVFTKTYFERQYEQMMGNNTKVTGVLCRGTDYIALEPPRHYKIPDIMDVVSKVKKKSEDQKADIIFLATEDEKVLEIFKEHFKDKLRYINSKRYVNMDNSILNTMVDPKDNGYQRDFNYLMSLYFISRANTKIYTLCSGSIISALMSKDTQNNHFMYRGHYGYKGLLVGANIVRETGRLIQIHDKPLLYYALNNMILLGICDISIIVSSTVKKHYENVVKKLDRSKLKISFIEYIEDTDILEIIRENKKTLYHQRICIAYEDNFFWGGNFIKKVSQSISKFDGAYVFSCTTKAESNDSKIEINDQLGIPIKVSAPSQVSNCNNILVGIYLFDRELGTIIDTLYENNKIVAIVDVLNQYIEEKKLLVKKIERGTIWMKIDSEQKCRDLSELIRIIQEQRGQSIGNVEESLKKLK